MRLLGSSDPVGSMGKVVDERLQHAFTEAVLDHLVANGAVKRYCRKLRDSYVNVLYVYDWLCLLN